MEFMESMYCINNHFDVIYIHNNTRNTFVREDTYL